MPRRRRRQRVVGVDNASITALIFDEASKPIERVARRDRRFDAAPGVLVVRCSATQNQHARREGKRQVSQILGARAFEYLEALDDLKRVADSVSERCFHVGNESFGPDPRRSPDGYQ